MKRQPAHTLYSIGFIVNAVFALFLPFAVASFATAASNPNILAQVAAGLNQSVRAVAQIMNVLALITLLVAITQMACIVIALYGHDKIVKGKEGGLRPFVLFIILGLFAQNLFYLVGALIDCFAKPAKEEPAKE